MNKSLEQYMPDGSKLPYRFMKYRIHKILLVCCSYDYNYLLFMTVKVAKPDGTGEQELDRKSTRLNSSH